jgi:hypothetical protein
MATQDTIKANLISLGFDNASTSALYNKVAEAVGVTVDTTITEIGNSENRIFNIINTQRYGKSGYYTSKALAFQYGDDLIVDPVTLDFVYAVIDSTKQIISQAAFEEFTTGNSSLLYLKIAALNATTGLLQPLTTPQFSAFQNYYVNFEIPGLPVTLINSPGNILFFNATATYYATYDLPTLQTNLINALNAFRNSFAFNGEFFAGDLQAYIKSNVPGIRDFFIYNTTIDGAPFAGSQNLASGYFNYIDNIQNNIAYTPI